LSSSLGVHVGDWRFGGGRVAKEFVRKEGRIFLKVRERKVLSRVHGISETQRHVLGVVSSSSQWWADFSSEHIYHEVGSQQ